MSFDEPDDEDYRAESSNRTAVGSSLSTRRDIDKNYGQRADKPDEQDDGELVRQAMSTSEEAEEDDNQLARARTKTLLGGRLKLRPDDDDGPTDWWFASTAIPLLSATFAPLANLLSIAGLVVYWRSRVTTEDPSERYNTSIPIPDPQWALNLNGASLAVGFLGNIFLLCNFTRKIRYIIALPMTILLFYLAFALLLASTVGMSVYDPPQANEVYSQAYWYATIAAGLYFLNAMLLMVTMLGYFLGHYPQHFDLSDEQRSLILQTMIFFVWLGGGAGIFARIEPDWSYVNALYFCDVTILTIGFGDFVATNDLSRGLIFPYSVIGTIILALMVGSIHQFAQDLSKEKVVKQHIETRRVNTLSRAVSPEDLLSRKRSASRNRLMSTLSNISRPLEGSLIQQQLDEQARRENTHNRTVDLEGPESSPKQDLKARLAHHIPVVLPSKKQKAILMCSEKDRFDRMRAIQHAAKNFREWYALTMSTISFCLLWFIGAIVFWRVESETQGLSYFQALYFCYVSLLTIGYGDLSPKSNAGKPLFVLWSLIAVPMMTILVSDLGDTAIGGFKRKVLDYGGLAFLGKGRGWGLDWFRKRKTGFQRRLSHVGSSHEKASELETADLAMARRRPGLPSQRGSDNMNEQGPRTIDELAEEQLNKSEMDKRLGYALRRVAGDMKNDPHKRYCYEEWVEFTRLIRYTKLDRRIQDSLDPAQQLEYDEALDGPIEWDWLGSDSPMTSEQHEPEWVLDRLLESLLRTQTTEYVEASSFTEPPKHLPGPSSKRSVASTDPEESTVVTLESEDARSLLKLISNPHAPSAEELERLKLRVRTGLEKRHETNT